MCALHRKQSKMAAVILFALTVLFTCFQFDDSAALPNYFPHLRIANGGRDALIEDYFCLGFNYSEVLSFLLTYHGIRLSPRHLKRILRNRGLRWKNIHSSIDRVVDAVEQELVWSGSSIGYRQMHQRLLNVIERCNWRSRVITFDSEL